MEEPQPEFDGVRAIPFEPRKFPLTDEEYESMNQEMPEVEEIETRPRSPSPSYIPSFTLLKHEDEVNVVKEDEDEGDLELMDVGEESDEEDDPDWQRAPGERAA